MSQPMQQQKTREPKASLQVALQGEVYAHEINGVQVITFCNDPKGVNESNILCAVNPAFPYDTQRIIADNIQHSLNWERGHR